MQCFVASKVTPHTRYDVKSIFIVALKPCLIGGQADCDVVGFIPSENSSGQYEQEADLPVTKSIRNPVLSSRL